MAKINKRGRKAPPRARRKTLAPNKAAAPAKARDTDLKLQLAAARAQQAATAEILKVIARSPTDTQPVFDAIVRNGLRLLGGYSAVMMLLRGDNLHLAAYTSTGAEGDESLIHSFPMPLAAAPPIALAAREGRTHVIEDVETVSEMGRAVREAARARGWRSALLVPLLLKDAVLGVVSITRRQPGRFPVEQVSLLESFAAQAVIAIENARLFNETKEALERQTATAEVLRVIGGSMTDTQPVFDAIVKNGGSLFRQSRVALWLIGGDQLHARATTGESMGSMPIDRGSAIGVCVLDGCMVHLPDLEKAADGYPRIRQLGLKLGFRSGIYAPLLREGRAIGGISVLRREVGAFDAKDVALLNTFADQAVIAIENVRLFGELGARNKDLAATLEQQTATAEILRVISRSPTDVQPVLDVVAESAARLCEAKDVIVLLREGDALRYRVHHGDITTAVPVGDTKRISRDWSAGRCAAEARQLHIHDILAAPDEFPDGSRMGKDAGYRTVLMTPLLREGIVLGVIGMRRAEVRPFEPRQIELINIFADQAVIAIENVRLFNETREALERQTATAEILRVISGSPTDVQPVFDAIVQSAKRLIGGFSALVSRIIGDQLHLAAYTSTGDAGDEALKSGYPRPLTDAGASGMALRARAPSVVSDTETDPHFPEDLRKMARARGWRSVVGVPMLREGNVIGTINVTRCEPGPFTDHQIGLLQTFADQAVIAIQNVRLFNETKEALERQTATAEILKVIASSPADVQPVFDAILRSAVNLCGAEIAAVFRYDGKLVHLGATHNWSEEALKYFSTVYPAPPSPELMSGRTILSRSIVTLPDAAADAHYDPNSAATGHWRRMLGAPMLREGQPLGALVVCWREPGETPQRQVDLLQTFADQAVIAIENVRLFNETKEALERQTATAEILKVIASSPADVQPVFDAVAESAARLCEANDVLIRRVNGDTMPAVAHYGELPVVAGSPPISRGIAAGRAILECRTIHIHDVVSETARDDYPEQSTVQRDAGYRALLAVPLIQRDAALGVILVRRMEMRPFAEKQIRLLETFADQAVIAIENVRLFNETREALEQQTATAEILQVISSSPTDTQPVFEAIVQAGLKLFPESGVLVTIPGGAQVRAVAVAHRDPARAAAMMNRFPIELSRSRLHGTAILDASLIDIPDAEAEKEGRYAPGIKNFLASGNRAITIAPLICGDAAIGAISVARAKPGPLSEKQVALLRTFAAQAVIAIENTRLFNETKEALERQTATAEILRVISSSPTDVQPVFDAIARSAFRLLSGTATGVLLRVGDGYRLVAMHFGDQAVGLPPNPEYAPIDPAANFPSRVFVSKAMLHIPDWSAIELPPHERGVYEGLGVRSSLMLPLLREDECIGVLFVSRSSVRAYTDKEIALMQSFVDQAVIAIENVRLFHEIEEKGRQLEVASRHKSDFLSSMSHELRTPLNAILGFNEMILGQVYGEVPADMQEPLADIQTSGKHLLRLINNVLDLAKIEAGRMELSLQDYSVHDTVASVHSTLRPLAAEKGLEFLASVPNDVPLAYGDGGRIAQCLMNLAGNSLKFTKAGKVEISVETKGDILVYKVSDTGIGIAADKIESLFTEFKQTDATIASEYGGTGLGLSISKKFVEMHGGRIWIESELGKGSAFIIEVPLRVETS
jgi:GAF domain-containing protein